MEKLTVVGNFMKSVEYLRNTECSQREKLQHFHHISECLATPSMISNEHFGKHVSSGIVVLLLFCEDLDSVVRMSAEENLNRLIRSVENTRLSRVLLDLYNEIKKNGNQKSLRICLNLFAHYCPRMKEKNVKWFAIKLLPCLQVIAQRKETLLAETLVEFMKCFSQYIQNCLNDNESMRLMEIFLADIVSDCSVKRRCSAQNCVSLIQGARNVELVAKQALNGALDLLHPNELSANKIIGVLGFLRLLLPIIISFPECENKQIIEIYDLCLYLLNNRNHSIINASLEVINAVLAGLSSELRALLISHDVHQNDFLKKRKSLKNQIFQLKNAELTCTASTSASVSASVPSTMPSSTNPDIVGKCGDSGGLDQQQVHASRKSSTETIKDALKSARKNQGGGYRADEQFSSESDGVHSNVETRENAGQDSSCTTNKVKVNNELRTVEASSTPVGGICRVVVDNVDDENNYANKMTSTSITAESEINEPQEEGHLHCTGEDKSQILSDVDNESFNSIDFESEIAIGIGNDGIDDDNAEQKKDTKNKSNDESISNKADSGPKEKDVVRGKADGKTLKSADSIGAFFNNLLSHPNTGTMTKLFRPSTKLSATTTEHSSSSPKTLSSASRTKSRQTNDIGELAKSSLQPSMKCPTISTSSTPTISSAGSGGGAVGMVTLTVEDDTISLESLSSHISIGSHVSQQSRNEQDLILALGNDSEIERKFDGELRYEVMETSPQRQEPLTSLKQDNENEMSVKTTTGSESHRSGNQQARNIQVDALFQSPRKGDLSDVGSVSAFDDANNVHLKIGSMHEQNIIYYTARFIAVKFLLSGYPGGLISDITVRVSIKSLSLAVLANCIELRPETLCLPLEIDKFSVENLYTTHDSSNENSSESISAQDLYSELQTEELATDKGTPEIAAEDDLLEIKDDHFGVSTYPFIFDSPLSKSVDQVLFAQVKNSNDSKFSFQQREKSKFELNQQLENILSKSDIIDKRSPSKFPNRSQKPHSADIKTDPLLNMPVFDSKSKQNTRTDTKQPRELYEMKNKQSQDKGIGNYKMDAMNSPETIQLHQNQRQVNEEKQNHDDNVEVEMDTEEHHHQYIYDVFLYCNHIDPVLRGNMQIIACNFTKALLSANSVGSIGSGLINELVNMMLMEHHNDNNQLLLHAPLNIEKLLTILIKGFRDEIHSVVIQALTAFDKIFHLLLVQKRNFDHSSSAQYRNVNENDIDLQSFELLLDPLSQSSQTIRISPKLLLNQLQFCFANKYWLVQNKYADIISNLDFNLIQDIYNEDIAVTYEQIFVEQLLQLIGDDDARVRDHVAACICDYIQNKSIPLVIDTGKGDKFDWKLVNEFLMQSTFRSMSTLLCDMLRNGGRATTTHSSSVLARILFMLTNKLMDLDKKNMQFGIINAIRVLVSEFNPIDNLHIWNEFNLIDLCHCFMLQNFTTATDLHMQISLIEINTKLLSANLLASDTTNPQLLLLVDNLFEHVMKILSIYYYLFSNQKPPIVSTKPQKSELIFVGTKESSVHHSDGEGSDCLYVKLYSALKVTFDNYKISISQETGNKLMSLCTSCLNSLSTLLEFKQNTNSPNGNVKLIEEILQYLTVIVNYLPIETINCLRQLLKFLFCRNYGNRKVEWENFLKLYLAVRNCEASCLVDSETDKGASGDTLRADSQRERCIGGADDGTTLRTSVDCESDASVGAAGGKLENARKDSVGSSRDRFNLSELFASAISFPLGKSKLEEDSAKHIKLFEPLVIYCLTLFMKSNATVQANVLDMLSDLLDFNVTYSILDSKNIIYEQVESNVELIDNGTARNANILIRSTIRFLVKLTKQNDCKLISIPKIISITNNLFINNSIRECSVMALKELAIEIFFKHPKQLNYDRIQPLSSVKERNAEREVILRMLEKFIQSIECQKVLSTLLLWARTWQTKIMASDASTGVQYSSSSCPVASVAATSPSIDSPTSCDSSVEQQSIILQQERAILSIVIGALQNDRIVVNNCETYFVLDAIFRNCDKSILLGSDLFESLLGLLMERHVENFNNLSYAVIILDNVILKTEQIYLANHVKLLFMKNSIQQLDPNKSVVDEDNEAELNVASGTGKQEKWKQHQQQRPGSEQRKLGGLQTGDSGSAGTSVVDDEINYFTKVLHSILETCFSTSITNPCDTNYRYLTSMCIRSVAKVAIKFEKVKAYLRSLFTYNTTIYEKLETSWQSLDELKVEILTLLCELCLGRDEGGSSSSSSCSTTSFCLTLQPRSILQYTQKIRKTDGQQAVLCRVFEKFKDINWWMTEDIKVLLSKQLLHSFLAIDTRFKCELTQHPVYSRLVMEQLLVLPAEFCKTIITSILGLISKINLNASFLKLKFLWRLLNDKSSILNRSSEKLIQLHFNNEVQSLESRLLQNSDCKVYCSRNNDAIDILKEIYNGDCDRDGGNQEHLNKLSLFTQSTLKRLLILFTNEERLRMDNLESNEMGYKRLNDEKASELQTEINEKWLMQQVVQMSSHTDCKAFAKVLMDFKSEIKLKTIFSAEGFSCKHILGPCLDISFHTMITTFQNNCVQYNPHINYMNLNPLLRVTLQTLFANLKLTVEEQHDQKSLQDLALPIVSLMRNLEKLESISLLYVKSAAIEKYIRDQLFKSEVLVEELLIEYVAKIATHLKHVFTEAGKHSNGKIFQIEIRIFLRCLEAIIKQKFVWMKLNQPRKYERHLNSILDMLHGALTNTICNTIFYKLYWLQHHEQEHLLSFSSSKDAIGTNCSARGNIEMGNSSENENVPDNKNANDISDSDMRTLRVRKAIFLAKLIEASMGGDDNRIHMKFIASQRLMKYFKSIAISLLRTNYYYGLAVVPYELFRTYSYDKQLSSYAKLPSIPVDHLSDLDILQKFIKRLSIFGFCTRQQFEEYFMTFLLLINRVYDVNMVDEQEQFLIRNACLTVIIELLIMCRTFPIVGTKISKFHHSTRWPRIKCRNNISLKKLHKVQLIIPGSNVFYHPNLERDLSAIRHDSIIGTNYFLPNQYELNQVWTQMESLSNELANINSGGMDGGGGGVGNVGNESGDSMVTGEMDNIKGDTSGIDLKSSCQLIFDVFTQILEQNHVLVLPNLVKFCEICDNREHIRWIKNTVMKLQEQIPFDDTISHQYIIYLLCRTQSILIPSLAELSHLCSIISTYLKSTHIFIRNATLHGLLCLLECCTKTSTTLGKLSEELCLLREIIVAYITHNGIVEESSTVFSEIHTKLVWTLNFSLIEMTTKFVPDCHLLSNTIISANNLLKRTTHEAVYLCVAHGLERIIVVNTTQKPICEKVEKLALELVKVENERFSLPALKLLLSCVYMGSSKQLETTEHSNGIVQDDPEIIAQQTEKVDVLLHRIKSSTSSAAKIYGEVLCQIVRDLVPPNEILTKVIKEFLAINQPHCEVIARIVYQVFRSCIDSSFLRMLQDWLICSLPNFLTLPPENGVWCLTIIFLSSSINLDLIKLFPFALHNSKMFGEIEILLFFISARDFYLKLNSEQKTRFRDIFKDCELDVYKDMLKCL